jgi:hypothetical protein
MVCTVAIHSTCFVMFLALSSLLNNFQVFSTKFYLYWFRPSRALTPFYCVGDGTEGECQREAKPGPQSLLK